jgi:hypothetical protein
MKNIVGVFSQKLYKNVFISYAVLQNGSQNSFHLETDFVYAFCKTETESKDALKNLLQQDGQIRETDFEAFF